MRRDAGVLSATPRAAVALFVAAAASTPLSVLSRCRPPHLVVVLLDLPQHPGLAVELPATASTPRYPQLLQPPFTREERRKCRRRSAGGGKRISVPAKGGVSGDRLSALPDVLLHAILSFLPAQQSVKTSALSRRWRHLWRTAPCVNIDAREFGITPGSDAGDVRKKLLMFQDFTTSLLLFRSGTVSLDKFRLDATRHCLPDVDRWVRRGIMYCPQVLEVLIPRSGVGVYCFPHLGASSCRLKRLHLNGVYLDDNFAEQIKSGCPSLEELELRSCSHTFPGITSVSLKRLIIDTLDNRSITKDHFVITAPCLVCFQMTVSYGCYGNGVSVNLTDSLLKASVSLRCYGKTFSLRNQRSLLADLCSVPNLELGGFMTKFRVDFLTRAQIARKSISLPHQVRKTFQCPELKSVEVLYEDHYDNKLIELLWGIGRILPNVTVTLTKVLLD